MRGSATLGHLWRLRPDRVGCRERRRPTLRASERLTLPNLIVIGAQKCGTSGLHYYLSLHPEVSMSNPKELNFFIEERNCSRGLEWYSRHFDPAAPAAAARRRPTTPPFPSTSGCPSGWPQVVPDARLVYIVRDPVERIAAHWVHNYAKRREKGDVRRRCCTRTPPTSRAAGTSGSCSASSSTTTEEQILVLEQQDLRDERAATLRRLFEFVGVDPDFEHPKFEQVRHSTSRKKRATKLGMRVQKASRTRARAGGSRAAPGWRSTWRCRSRSRSSGRPASREALGEEVLEVLHEDAEKLRQWSGRALDHWSV